MALADQLQGLGIEAVPVADFGDASADPQLRTRGHFVALDHPVLGPGEYERNGIRVSGAPCGYRAPSPPWASTPTRSWHEVLGLDDAEITRLRDGRRHPVTRRRPLLVLRLIRGNSGRGPEREHGVSR